MDGITFKQVRKENKKEYVYSIERSKRINIVEDVDCLSPDVIEIGKLEMRKLDLTLLVLKLEKIGFTVCIDTVDIFYETC